MFEFWKGGIRCCKGSVRLESCWWSGGGWQRRPGGVVEVAAARCVHARREEGGMDETILVLECDNKSNGGGSGEKQMSKGNGECGRNAGCSKELSPLPPRVRFCELCGTGDGVMVCTKCDGDGVVRTRRGGAGVSGVVGTARCSMCNGIGSVPCPQCSGMEVSLHDFLRDDDRVSP